MLFCWVVKLWAFNWQPDKLIIFFSGSYFERTIIQPQGTHITPGLTSKSYALPCLDPDLQRGSAFVKRMLWCPCQARKACTGLAQPPPDLLALPLNTHTGPTTWIPCPKITLNCCLHWLPVVFPSLRSPRKKKDDFKISLHSAHGT